MKQIAGRTFNFYVRAGERRSSDNVNDGDRPYKVPNKYILDTTLLIELDYFRRGQPSPPKPFEPPTGFKEYRDAEASISVHIPDGWVVNGICEGRQAIFHLYPEGKYFGSEPFESSDTKCDLNIHEPGSSVEEMIQEWHASALTTIISEEDDILLSIQPGKRLEIKSMGRSAARLLYDPRKIK